MLSSENLRNQTSSLSGAKGFGSFVDTTQFPLKWQWIGLLPRCLVAKKYSKERLKAVKKKIKQYYLYECLINQAFINEVEQEEDQYALDNY